jgi:hypothetical protein
MQTDMIARLNRSGEDPKFTPLLVSVTGTSFRMGPYSAATTSFPRGVMRSTSIDAARHATPLARNASR